MKSTHLAFYPSLVSSLFITAVPATLNAQDKANLVETKHLSVADDLEITLWAKTPHFYNPTNMDMDAFGNMWVAEGVNYRKHKDRQPAGDRIMVLQDSNNDGKVDKSHVFVQEKGFKAPLGISVFDNQIVVAQPPNLIVYTDVDRNLKFDPAIDKREVLLSGFNGRHHDHSLHSTTAGPDGKWYFNQGNCGAKFTDKSGKTFSVGSSYKGGYDPKDWPHDPLLLSNEKSDDGYLWLGGFIGKMNPDGTNAEILGHNLRNAYEHTVTSMGDVFHSDNDDPPACRNAYLLEYGNSGFSSADGKYSWEAERRPGQDIPTAHWRQENPGTAPAGDVYGSGSPTGVAFYENGALPAAYNGSFLACDAGRRDIMQYVVEPKGAGYKLDRQIFLKTTKDKSAFNFRPSDVEVGADGCIYVSDWFDPRVGGHADLDDSRSGAIYRIAPKGYKNAALTPDFKTVEGQINLLKSPSDNVRFIGFTLLKKSGAKAIPEIKKLMLDKNPYIAARGIWLLPHLGDEGLAHCKSLLTSDKPHIRRIAYKALRSAGQSILPLAKQLINDADPQVRREIASSIRTLKYAQKKDLLISLYQSWDGKDRYYLEALGLAATYAEAEFWNDLKALNKEVSWTDKFATITWRLHPEEALDILEKRATDKTLTEAQRKLAIDTVAFTPSKNSPQVMLAIYKAGVDANYAQMWFSMNLDGRSWDGLIDRDLVAKVTGLAAPADAVPYKHPEAPAKRNIPDVAAISALKGDIKKGEIIATRCIMCHEVGDKGKNFGPSLTGWGLKRNKQQILNAILTPDADIAHGFTGSTITLKNGGVINGLVKSGGDKPIHFVHSKGLIPYLVVVTMGGTQQKISWKQIKSVTPMKRSLMLYPEQLGLTNAQEIADLVSYLQQLKE